jgi:hypothetical protein
MVRAPIEAPAPMLTNGPIDAPSPITASLATALKGLIPAVVETSGANSDTACANAEYGSSVRRTAQGTGAVVPLVRPRMTADARVVASCGR